MLKTRESERHFVDLTYSIGLAVDSSPDASGAITDVLQGSAAAKAGIGPGMRLVTSTGRKWSPEVCPEAGAAAKAGTALGLLVENNDFFKSYTVEYAAGELYPPLLRDESNLHVL